MAVCIVFGASGAIGRFLIPRLLASGDEVIAVSRIARASTQSAVRWTVGALPTSVPSLPAADAIFSVGPLDAFASWLAAASISDAPRIVAIGSMSIETKRSSADRSEQVLAARLMQAERTLADAARARRCAWTVLRPTLVYGAGLDRSLSPIARFAARWHVFPYVTHATGLRQPVHADDLAAGCIDAAAATATHGQFYGVGGGERIAFATMLARVRDSLPGPTLGIAVPPSVARAGIALARRIPAFAAASSAALDRLASDLVVDDAAARADFGWSPRAFHPTAADWTPAPLS